MTNTRINALDGIATTVVLVLESLLDVVREEIPEVKITYDEKLSYETASEAFRANNNLDTTSTNLYPLFAFRRSVLRHAEAVAPGQRATNILAKRNMDLLEKPKTSNVYRLLHGEFDLNFLFITKDIQHLENFEVLYLAEEGISSYKELEVDLTAELGDKFTYFAHYDPLDDKVFESDNLFYKMVQGTIKIRGFYPILRAEAKHILEINNRVLDMLGGVYHSKQIKA